MRRNSKACKRFLTALLVAALLLSLTAPAALASVKAVIKSNTKVYSASGKAVNVPKGLTVSVSAVRNGWAKISYKGATGFIRTSQLKKAASSSSSKRATAYTAKSTPVYSAASSSSSKLGTLSIATKVYVVGKSGDYYRVQNNSGSVTGYIKSGNLTTKAKLTAAYNAYKKQQQASKNKPSGGSSGGNTSTLVGYMQSLVGRPYSSSASLSSAPGHFNCSTFVNYVMKKFHISTKSTAKGQANDGSMKKITSLSNLRLGDILCFDGNGDGVCDHTAIYAGGGAFYEASQVAGKVHKNSFSDYYRQHFMWARRP